MRARACHGLRRLLSASPIFTYILCCFTPLMIWYSSTTSKSSVHDLSLGRSWQQGQKSNQTQLPRHTESQCTALTAPNSSFKYARFVIFQRNGGKQLLRSVLHYSSVSGYNSVVIIDHLGSDRQTAAYLQKFKARGADVWRCEGAWANKSRMWSDVARVYSPNTGYIFPLDADELLMTREDNSNDLLWSKQAFISSLRALELLEFRGKAFKMEWVLALPPDCSSKSVVKVESLVHDFCDVQYAVKRGFNCMSKCFSRGSEFLQTDQGNHRLVTVGNMPEICDPDSLHARYYLVSRLVLVHVQQLSFDEWLSHFIRGASDYSYNNYALGSSCRGDGVHYCNQFQRAMKVNFSYYDLRRFYMQDVMCQKPKGDMYRLNPIKLEYCQQ